MNPYFATLAVNLEEMTRMKPRVGPEFCSTENNLQNLGWHLLCISVSPLRSFLVISFPLSGHSGVSIAAEAHLVGWDSPPQVQAHEGGSRQSSSTIVCFSHHQSRDESGTQGGYPCERTNKHYMKVLRDVEWMEMRRAVWLWDWDPSTCEEKTEPMIYIHWGGCRPGFPLLQQHL